MLERPTRRDALTLLAAGAAGALVGGARPGDGVVAQEAGERPERDPGVTWENPGLAVPVSIIVDDSTCLVNLNRFAIPQFAAAFGVDRYGHDWRSMPVEIPDAFVVKFADWADEHGVRGKWSVVPYPACVGRLDRELPGWPVKDVARSIGLVQKRITPAWDIHPEMVTHTRVIDTATGHPHPAIGPDWQENAGWTTGKSAEQIADYLRYALAILKNVDLPCTGITTPGGFGNKALPQLASASLTACRDVFGTDVPHYFRHLYESGERSVAPRVELARNVAPPTPSPWSAGGGTGADPGRVVPGRPSPPPRPECVVSIIGCTGDWTGGWDCSDRGDIDRFITPDLARGRLVEVIDRGEPACLVCHWTGIYFNGEEVGLDIFKEVVRRLHQKYDHLAWMKLSEIATYWAARELTTIRRVGADVELYAPFACPGATLSIGASDGDRPGATGPIQLEAVAPTGEIARRAVLPDDGSSPRLAVDRYRRRGEVTTVRVDLVPGWQRLRPRSV